MKDFVLGASYLLRGLRLTLNPRVFLFALIPFTLNVLLFAGLTWGIFSYSGSLADAALAQIPEGFHWLSGLIWLLVTVAVVLVVYFLFTPIANILCAPFNGPLAERAERVLTGTTDTTPFSWARVMRDARKSIRAELHKLGYMACYGIPLLILFVVPVLQLAAPFLWFAFSAWMLAVQYFDYPMGNHGIFFKDQRKRLGQQRGVVLGLGSMIALFTMIPVINFATIPIAVVATTALWVDRFRTGDDQPR
jgi:CysZ protein